MVAAWIGKGVVTPFCASLRTMLSERPRSAKVTSGVFGSGVFPVTASVPASVRASAVTSSFSAFPGTVN